MPDRSNAFGLNYFLPLEQWQELFVASASIDLLFHNHTLAQVDFGLDCERRNSSANGWKGIEKTEIFITDKDKETRGASDSGFSLKEHKHGPEDSWRLRKWHKTQSLKTFYIITQLRN